MALTHLIGVEQGPSHAILGRLARHLGFQRHPRDAGTQMEPGFLVLLI